MWVKNQLMNTLITLQQKIDCRKNVFPKKFVAQSIFITGGIFLITRRIKKKKKNIISTKEKHNFNSLLMKMVST